MGRTLGFVGTIIVMAIVVYVYSLQVRSSVPGAGASPAGSADIAGVKNDLISIANAERGCIASQGKSASLDELISGNYITIQRTRPPYFYDIETTSTGFRVTATCDTPGAHAQFWIDESMEIKQSD